MDMGEDVMDARVASTTIWLIAMILKMKCVVYVDDVLLCCVVSGVVNRLNICVMMVNV